MYGIRYLETGGGPKLFVEVEVNVADEWDRVAAGLQSCQDPFMGNIEGPAWSKWVK